MNHSTPGLPVHHQLPEFTQTHVHRVRDAIQPSHPLSSPLGCFHVLDIVNSGVMTWKQPKCLLTDEWIKMWYVYTMNITQS